jgi:hypothetical protein
MSVRLSVDTREHLPLDHPGCLHVRAMPGDRPALEIVVEFLGASFPDDGSAQIPTDNAG